MATFTPGELRDNLAKHEQLLRTDLFRHRVLNVALNIAKGIGDPRLVALAQELPPAESPSHFEAVLPDGRDDALNTKVEAFIAAAHASIDQRQEKTIRIVANSHLSRSECRARVSAHLAKDREPHEARDIAYNLDLSADQVLDALEQLEHERAIVSSRIVRTYGEPPRHDWRVGLNALGRNLADGTAPVSTAPVVLNQTIYDSQITNAGIAQGAVTQNVAINPDIVEMIDALKALQEAAAADPQAAAVDALARETEEELRTNGWSAKARSFLSGIGGLVQTAAALKPAYNTLQTIAVAHNVPLPAWP
jgi:hypothetical protein